MMVMSPFGRKTINTKYVNTKKGGKQKLLPGVLKRHTKKVLRMVSGGQHRAPHRIPNKYYTHISKIVAAEARTI